VNVRKNEKAFGDSMVANFSNKRWHAKVTGYLVSAAL
jgi:hypothetical protein